LTEVLTEGAFKMCMEECGGAIVTSLGLSPSQWQRIFDTVGSGGSGGSNRGDGVVGGVGGIGSEAFVKSFKGYLDESAVLDAARDAIYVSSLTTIKDSHDTSGRCFGSLAVSVVHMVHIMLMCGV
jgi:hypothetical protein